MYSVSFVSVSIEAAPLWGLRMRMHVKNVALFCGAIIAAVSACAIVIMAAEVRYVYFDRHNLPDLGLFTRFEFSTVGHIYDAGDRPLIELAREQREISRYEDIPPIVRDAILAAEDKRFFSHNGIDYLSLPRVLGKVRVGMLAGRLARGGRHDELRGSALFPQGGSTITQQLVRGNFLRGVTARENSYELRPTGLAAGALSSVMGARSVNMLARKREEMRLSFWLEREMRNEFGSKRRAKEEILARYATFVYMGNGQHTASRGRRNTTSAGSSRPSPSTTPTKPPCSRALPSRLATTRRAPRTRPRPAPPKPDADADAGEWVPVTGGNGARRLARTRRRAPRHAHIAPAPAVVEHVLEELAVRHADLSVEDLLQGRIQVYATADARVQQIVNDALEHGLARYEKRHPRARGLIQGSVVVLHNRDGRILAEAGGRRVFNGRSASYSDYNRVTKSLRQPGSAMKPMVYLAAFRSGDFTLETMVPDEPISVPNGDASPANGSRTTTAASRGLIPVRQALAESRNAVAMWITAKIGIDRVLRTSRSLGVRTPLQRYPTTALGASEINLLELANAYRTMASGIVAEPYVIRAVVRDSGEILAAPRRGQCRSPLTATRCRSSRKACAVWCACPRARRMPWRLADFRLRSWARPARRVTSGMPSSWARPTVRTASRRRSESASTTTVHWDREKPAGDWRCRSFRN